MSTAYPELLLLDATYKLNHLEMPLYLLVGEDGIGASEVACLWVVADKEKVTIRHLVSKLKQVQPMCAQTITVMTDKKMTEQNLIKSESPHIELLICLFHTRHTFHREINAEKFHITAVLCNFALEIIPKKFHF